MLWSLLRYRKSDLRHGGCARGEDMGGRRMGRSQVLSSRLRGSRLAAGGGRGVKGGLKVYVTHRRQQAC